jgi:S1-C subfamily serine protease
VTTVDWIALAVVLVSALGGLRSGLVLSFLSLAGLVAGAYAGSRIAPHLLSGGATSRWTPVAGLFGALVGAVLLQALAGVAGSLVRGGLRLTPLRVLDSAGGLVFGLATGLVLVWVAGAAALLLPGQTTLRKEVQRSRIVRRLDEAVPPQRLLHLLARVDPFPSIVGPAAPERPAGPAIARAAGVRTAGASVVKVLGTACGLGLEGSGWFATASLVVTNAHVVAGERDTKVQLPGGARLYDAEVVGFDPHDDVAVLRVRGAGAQRPLRMAEPRDGAPVGILGYPENGPLRVTPGRIGRTSAVVTRDAYGRGPVMRTITAIAGTVRHGNSGGPAVDARGRVQATIFAARLGAPTGYGVPTATVRRVLRRVGQEPVSPGGCVS